MAIETNKTNKRQDFIIFLFETRGGLSISSIMEATIKNIARVSKVTVNRDLKKLIKLGLIKKEGKGRAVFYSLSEHYNLIKTIEVENYFKTEPDRRTAHDRFNFQIFSFLKNIFTNEEKIWLTDLNEKYQNNIKHLSKTIIKQEMERLIIEFSWKSSQIEGNTYTLLETEVLIKESKEAAGHKKEEAIMILDHKNALDFILKNNNEFKKITLGKIEHVHSMITKNLGIPRNIRKSPVGVTGTKYKPLDNEWQIKEALEKSCAVINSEEDVFAKSIISSIMVAYVQPFEDGNKRTARILSNAVLLVNNSCPLSYRSANEAEYKKAVLLFFEQNNISYFKKLFMQQYEFAVDNYFRFV